LIDSFLEKIDARFWLVADRGILAATSMVVVVTYWLSFEYVRDPRRALEGEGAQQALLRGAHHVLHLLVPYLESAQRQHLLRLAGAYTGEVQG
jgi:hypothetical protein